MSPKPLKLIYSLLKQIHLYWLPKKQASKGRELHKSGAATEKALWRIPLIIFLSFKFARVSLPIGKDPQSLQAPKCC